VVSSNQPFTVVEEPAFEDLMQATYQGDEPLHMPSASTVKRRVMDRAGESIEAQKAVFEVGLSTNTERRC
jgi:hypothetical protein